MLTRAFIVAALFHGIASVIWGVGFACGMTAFGSGQGVGLGGLLLTIHSILFLPVFILDAFGLPLIDTGLMHDSETFLGSFKPGILGPFPSIATVLWSFALGFITCRLHAKKREKQALRQMRMIDTR